MFVTLLLAFLADDWNKKTTPEMKHSQPITTFIENPALYLVETLHLCVIEKFAFRTDYLHIRKNYDQSNMDYPFCCMLSNSVAQTGTKSDSNELWGYLPSPI